jgi:hypothetical protein
VTPLTAAERQAIRERHGSARDGMTGEPLYCWLCASSGNGWPCTTVRLLDALDATEKELDEARDQLARLRVEKHHWANVIVPEVRDEARQAAIQECIEAAKKAIRHGIADLGMGMFGATLITDALFALLPQPAAPVATAETCGHYEHVSLPDGSRVGYLRVTPRMEDDVAQPCPVSTSSDGESMTHQIALSVTVCFGCGKHCYKSRKHAKHAARHIGHHGLSAYQCHDSGYWHLGHLPAAVKAGRISRMAL